jgi:lipopolysaccharide transport system permease protein
MITKVYFPRVLLPASAVGANLVDLAIATLVLLAMMVFGGIPPSPALLAAPLFVALAAATALAVGLWLAVLNVRYRDVRYVVPFLVQIWLLATPVAYPASLVPEAWRPLYGLNPMAGVVEGFRWALLGSAAAPGPIVAVSAATVAALLVGGFTWFRRMEQEFADVI